MSPLREHLADQIARKVQAYGLVVWEDAEGEYSSVAASLVPEGTRFESFDGSWYELRRRVEEAFGGEGPPALVVHVPEAPAEDPLAEIRTAGAEFKRNLSTLVRQALAGRLTEHRVAEIARDARTLLEAEAAVEGGGDADVRLMGVLGSGDGVGMLVRVLLGEADDKLDAAAAWDAVSDLCRVTVGAKLAKSGDELRSALFRHLVLCDLASAVEGDLPDAVTGSWTRPAPHERRRAAEVFERLRSSAPGRDSYLRLAAEVDVSLALADTLVWGPGLDTASGTPGVDAVCLAEAIRRLIAGQHAAAAKIAARRLETSPVVADPVLGWGARWRTVEAVGQLRTELAAATVPPDPPGRLLGWYTEVGWRVDRAHRRLELARTELGAFGELEEALTAARVAYDRWLDSLLDRFTGGLVDAALEFDGLVRQGEVHDRYVADAERRTAYVWVDALRYELGVDLADALGKTAERVELYAAVAAPPTITPVGMANLLPGAASNLRLTLDGDRLRVSLGGTEVDGVPARRDLLRARHGAVADLDLNDASQKGEKALSRAIGDARVVLVRSQEVDAAGESGLLSVAWAHFETVVNLLASVIARLAQAGVERVVISADHGFIALSQDLDTHRVVDAPAGAVGTTKRRVFIGRGGTPNPATVRVPLAACGIAGDIDLVVPRGLAVFRAGGGRQFFHGGLSPQELVVPVIVVDLAPAPEPQKLQVDVAVAGGRITTGVFAATLGFRGDLFTNEVTVRVVAAGAGTRPVARVVSGDGYDPDTGTVTVAAGQPSVLTFQVTGNLAAGAEVDLQVLDARTGRKLAASSVAVAAPIVVEDELD